MGCAELPIAGKLVGNRRGAAVRSLRDSHGASEGFSPFLDING